MALISPLDFDNMKELSRLGYSVSRFKDMEYVQLGKLVLDARNSKLQEEKLEIEIRMLKKQEKELEDKRIAAKREEIINNPKSCTLDGWNQLMILCKENHRFFFGKA